MTCHSATDKFYRQLVSTVAGSVTASNHQIKRRVSTNSKDECRIVILFIQLHDVIVRALTSRGCRRRPSPATEPWTSGRTSVRCFSGESEVTSDLLIVLYGIRVGFPGGRVGGAGRLYFFTGPRARADGRSARLPKLRRVYEVRAAATPTATTTSVSAG